MFREIEVQQFNKAFLDATELSRESVGGQILSFSDEFFASALNLLKTGASKVLEGFGPNGKLYDGWESRRHNETYDWCIIRLGTSGKITGFDVDTSHFNGNEAPEASVEALYHNGSLNTGPEVNDSRWFEVLPRVKLGPDARHLFRLDNKSTAVNHVKLIIYPDGGIARFRTYGDIISVSPSRVSTVFDLAHIFSGGRVECVSDQHFGVGSNLILPGRGENIGDGWETKRSRDRGHKDWVVIKLGFPGILEKVDIDTAHYIGNFPKHCELHAAYFSELDVPDWKSLKTAHKVGDWDLVLPRTERGQLGPDKLNRFQLENTEGKTYTHVRLTIYPDGGVQRVRVLGRRSVADHGEFNEHSTMSNHREI